MDETEIWLSLIPFASAVWIYGGSFVWSWTLGSPLRRIKNLLLSLSLSGVACFLLIAFTEMINVLAEVLINIALLFLKRKE